MRQLILAILLFLYSNCNSWSTDITQWQCVKDADYINGFDAWMGAERAGFFIAGQQSYHDNGREDRRFQWDYCRPDDSNTDYSFATTVNRLADTAYDSEFWRQCPDNAVISRVESWYDNNREDRQYRIFCKTLQPQFTLKGCGWSGWVNGYDAFLDYKCNGIINGIHSHHNNDREDRLYDFRCCGILNTPMDIVLSIDNERLLTAIISEYANDVRNTRSLSWGKPRWYVNSADVVQSTYILTHTQGDTYFWTRVCPTNGGLRSVSSDPNSDSFDFECGTLVDALTIKQDSCYWTNYLNDFGASFTAGCNKDGPIRGIQSYYSPSSQDRKFKVYCCIIARGLYSKYHSINIALKVHTTLGAETQATLTLDLCWNNDQYQAVVIPSSIDTWFTVQDVVKYGECGNTRQLVISTATNVDDDVTITAVRIEDQGKKYTAITFNDCTTNSDCTVIGEFTLNTTTSDVVISYPDDYVTSCLDTDGTSEGCTAELHALNGYQQYLMTITACGSYNPAAGIPAIGVVLRGTNGNFDKKILTGPDFDELPVGEGNIGDLIHISIEYESGPDFCIEEVIISDPYNENHVFSKNFFGDGTIIADNCFNDGDFRLLSGIQYVPCYDKPFSIKTYVSSTYTSIQIHACSGSDGGITAANSALLTMTITGLTKNQKFISTEAYLLKSTVDWTQGDSRDFTLPISGEFDKISVISITNNHQTDALCVDSVLVNGVDAFLTHYWVGFTSDHDALQTIPAVLEWPICDVELTTIIQAESPLPVDPDTVATSTCVNSNRLLSVECQISQTFQTYREVSWEHQTGKEISTEVAMEAGTSTSTSLGWSLDSKVGTEVGSDATGKVTNEIAAGLSGEVSMEFSASMSVSNGQTNMDVKTDGKVDGTTIGIDCTGSVTVPPNQQVQYSMLIEQSAAELTTLTDIKMTKCSAYLYPDSYNDPNNYVYITGIEGKLKVKDATNCYVSFSQATQVSSHGLTCGQERALATREWGTFVPLCDPDDYDMYQKCQCSYGDTRTQPTCGCVDQTTGNLLTTMEAAVVAETDNYKWTDWCDDNCNWISTIVNGTNNVTEIIIEEKDDENSGLNSNSEGEGSEVGIWYLLTGLVALVAITYVINSCISCFRKKPIDAHYRAVPVDTDTV